MSGGRANSVVRMPPALMVTSTATSRNGFMPLICLFIMPEVRCTGQAGSVQVAAREVFLAATHLAFAFHTHFERAVDSVGRARVGIVTQAVLRSKLAVDTVEHISEL